jgi:hypothetical protein
MNKLPLAKRVQILAMLCEGSSMRSISRVADVSINTVTKLLVDAGQACAAFHDQKVRGLTCKRIQCDEIWSFCFARPKNLKAAKNPPEGAGECWTWTSICSDSKLMCNWVVGGRDAYNAMMLMDDLAQRLTHRVQLTCDANRAYLEAVEGAFGADVDFGQLVKLYGDNVTDAEQNASASANAWSRATRTRTHQHIVCRAPEPAMRMSMRRFTRLTNAHSKKLANHCHALALYFTFYNCVRVHSSLRVTPAMAAGLTDTLMSWDDLVRVIDEFDGSQAKQNSN